MTDPNSHEYITLITNLKRSLKEFRRAYHNLDNNWRTAMYKGYVDDIGINSYPFDTSFDDLDVDAWVDSACEELDNLLDEVD